MKDKQKINLIKYLWCLIKGHNYPLKGVKIKNSLCTYEFHCKRCGDAKMDWNEFDACMSSIFTYETCSKTGLPIIGVRNNVINKK